jgi:hypothetical protein
MTKRLVLALIALTGIALMEAAAQPAVFCAVPPVPPVGCTLQDGKCLCDASGHCRWLYNCTHNSQP